MNSFERFQRMVVISTFCLMAWLCGTAAHGQDLPKGTKHGSGHQATWCFNLLEVGALFQMEEGYRQCRKELGVANDLVKNYTDQIANRQELAAAYGVLTESNAAAYQRVDQVARELIAEQQKFLVLVEERHALQNTIIMSLASGIAILLAGDLYLHYQR